VIATIFMSLYEGARMKRVLSTREAIAGIRTAESALHQSAHIAAISRRQLLISLGEASALMTVAGAVVNALPRDQQQEHESVASAPRWSDSHPPPNADAAVKPAPGTRPEITPLESLFNIDISSGPQVIRDESWNLQIKGLAERPMNFRLSDIRQFEPMHQFVTLACISNPIAGKLIGTTRWTGVSLQRLLREISPLPQATHIKIASSDGFFEVVGLETVRRDKRIMLAYDWDGVPLAAEHGYPLRIFIPDCYGMKQPKWILSLELIDHPEDGYWVERGWDAVARVRTTSVIDTTAGKFPVIRRNDGLPLIPLGGIAFSGARGISKVQVRLDKGSWDNALLRTPLSETTWVLWRYDWPFKAGRHTFAVRCFEGDGTPQITAEAPAHPAGATGLHSPTLNFRS
jgi:DMSO/TMAO reductase YedYZ molybdopterin-dependent catalytic subunit